MAQQNGSCPPAQEGDWPPGYVPGQGFEQPPTQAADVKHHPEALSPQHHDDGFPAASPNTSSSGSADSGPAPNSDIEPVPLKYLKPRKQHIQCPNCNQLAETRWEGRSEGRQKFMNVFWWPLPNRKHWWEKTHWYCTNCDKEIAMQKNGKDLQVLIGPGQPSGQPVPA